VTILFAADLTATLLNRKSGSPTMPMNDKRVVTKGSKAFVKFLQTHQITPKTASDVLDCAAATIWDLCQGVHRPGVRVALRIERWTGGAIRCEDFATPAESRALAKLKPHPGASSFKRSSSSSSQAVPA
jgi:hypothetical protein